MRMVRTGIYLELPHHLTTETVLWEHAAHCLFDEALRMVSTNLLECLGAETTGVPGVTEVDLVGLLVA